MGDRLYRSESDRILAGVCGGIAELYDLDPAIVRLLTFFMVLFTGGGLLVYLAAAILIPSESELEDSKTEEADTPEALEDSGESQEETGSEEE